MLRGSIVAAIVDKKSPKKPIDKSSKYANPNGLIFKDGKCYTVREYHEKKIKK